MRAFAVQLLCTIALAVTASAQPCPGGWAQSSAGVRPGVPGVAWDDARGRLVVFGGRATNGAMTTDTWEWDGASWDLRAQTGPPARLWSCMAYDAARHVSVLFGGQDQSIGSPPSYATYGDTWEWDGTTWTERQVPGPSGRWGATMAYDAGRQKVVLYGGFNFTWQGDTWEWDGASWTPIPVANSPGPLRFCSMVYDEARQQLLLFGGEWTSNGYRDVLWAYDGTTWTPLTATGPAARKGAAMAFDRSRNVVVMHGGQGGGFNPTLFSDTWQWNGQEWAELQGAAGTSGMMNGAGYDASRSIMVMQGPTALWKWPGPSLTVTHQPPDASAPLGSPVSLATSASGIGAISFQWRKDGVALTDVPPHLVGSQTPTLVFDALGAADLGTYRCDVTDACQTQSTRDVAVTECVPPAMPDAASARLLPLGSNAQLTTTLTGTGPLDLHWHKDGAPLEDGVGLSGTHTAVLQFTGVSAARAGTYQLAGSNPCGTALSAGIAVTPCSLPQISQQPVTDIFVVGTSTGLSVTATSEYPESYRWLKDGVALIDDARIQGASTTAFTIFPVQASDAGVYSVEITSACGTTTSAAVGLAPCGTLTIDQAPASAQVQPGALATFTVAASIASPGATVFQWFKNGVALSEGPHYHGVTRATLDVENVGTAEVGDYTVQVSHFCGVVESAPAHLALCDAPVIDQQPETPSFAAGFPAVFTVGVAAGTSPTYRWLKDGVTLADNAVFQGTTSAQLTVTSVASSSAGVYQCLVTTPCATTASDPIVFSEDCTPTFRQVSLGARIGGVGMAWDDARQRLVLFGGMNSDGSMSTDTWEWDGSSWALRSRHGPPPRLWSCMAYDAARQVCVLYGGQDQTRGTPPFYATYSDTWEWDGSTWTEKQVPGPSARWGATMGYDPERHKIVLYGGFHLFWQADTWEWDGTSWAPISTPVSPGPLRYARMTYDEARHQFLMFGGEWTSNEYRDQLWAYDGQTWTTLASGGPAPRKMHGLAFDRHRGVVIMHGGQGGGFNPTLFGDTWQWDGQAWTELNGLGGPAGPECFAFYDQRHETIFLKHSISAWELLTGSTPAVSVAPTLVERTSGTDVDLTATVSACGISFNYQWRKNGVDLSDDARFTGTQTDHLVIHAATASESGAYSVQVTGADMPAVSNPVTVRICTPPSITTQPDDVLVPLGTGTSFTVIASGAEPLVYQWRHNNVAIPGANSATFAVASVTHADEGSYSVTVQACGSTVLSRAATLNVAQAPIVLFENATPISPYVVHLSWATQDPAQATLEYGPTPALGLLMNGPPPAVAGSLDVSRGSWSNLFYRLTWAEAGGVTTGGIHEVVFPAEPATLSFAATIKASFIAFPSTATGVQMKLRLANLGPGAITGALDLTSATLGNAEAKSVSGVLTTPKRLAIGLAVGTSLAVNPDLTFRRSEIGASAGTAVTFRALASWWPNSLGTGPATTQLYTQRVLLPRR